jgi:ribosomal protein S12 methylthiotransferase accessory factor
VLETQRPPIIFVGPSIPLARARQTLPRADYRAPIRRGDLEGIPPGTVVGVIDGFFAHTLAISPGEVREAVNCGVAVFGAASMGALRAAEVPTVVGVGRIFEMYRTGLIERDDEVAVLLDPDTHQALTEPLVNVRFAVERLVRTGTLNREAGAEIVDVCARMHYTERTYRNILAHSRLAANKDVDDIIQLLQTFDLKRDDAQLLLEIISTAKAPPPRPVVARVPYVMRTADDYQRVKVHEHSGAPVMVWESGDSLKFSELVLFLKVTGKFEAVARNAIARFAAAGTPLVASSRVGSNGDRSYATESAQALLDATRVQWGWESSEEAHVTMRDLGLGLDDVADSLEAEATIRRLVVSFGKHPSHEFSKALRAELWLNELSLKREVLRLGALNFFTREGSRGGPPSDVEVGDARRTVARLRSVMRWRAVVARLDELGVPEMELDQTVNDIALARRAARPVVDAMKSKATDRLPTPRASGWRDLGIGLESSPKPPGTARFSLRETEAAIKTEAIARQIGIQRIGLVGELDTLGVYIAQAFGERSGWSSSFSSGKAVTREGARVGSIMEEVEIHAQDGYRPKEQVRASYAKGSFGLPLVDPRELGLPFDSRYSETLEIDWAPCMDLISGRTKLVPSACLLGGRQANDIFYCPRLGGKIFSSSGLGSGFSMAEAVVHAAAEYIERHAYRLAELELDNPGGVGVRQFSFIDEASLPATPADIVAKYRNAGMSVRILDITSEVAVPTFYTRVFDDLFKTDHSISSDGFACHPDPEVAVTMALLESAQTRGGFIAGGREDYSLQARSLGRHERPRTAVPRSQISWFSNDRPVRPLADTAGFKSRDILQELEWMVDRVLDAGCEMLLVADFTMPRIRPAYAVRVLIPGLETTNPLFTGRRARATILRDLLPRAANG